LTIVPGLGQCRVRLKLRGKKLEKKCILSLY